MDTIKGTMTEIYNDLSKSTTGNTIAEVNTYKQLGAYQYINNTFHYLRDYKDLFTTDSAVKDRDRETPMATSTRVVRDET